MYNLHNAKDSDICVIAITLQTNSTTNFNQETSLSLDLGQTYMDL